MAFWPRSGQDPDCPGDMVYVVPVEGSSLGPFAQAGKSVAPFDRMPLPRLSCTLTEAAEILNEIQPIIPSIQQLEHLADRLPLVRILAGRMGSLLVSDLQGFVGLVFIRRCAAGRLAGEDPDLLRAIHRADQDRVVGRHDNEVFQTNHGQVGSLTSKIASRRVNGGYLPRDDIIVTGPVLYVP